MKNKVLFGFFLSLLVFSFSSGFKFNAKQEAMLVGKWKFVDYFPNAKIFEEGADHDEKLRNLKKSMLSKMKDAYIEVNADYTFINFDGKESKKGTWKLSEDGKIMSTTNAEGVTKNKEISLLTQNKLQYTAKNPKDLVDLYFMEKVK